MPEAEFAALVDQLAAGSAAGNRLAELLQENHPLYEERSTAAAIRMRGWVLVTLGRVAVTDDALLLILEELETGLDPYLVAAAARAARACPHRSPGLTPFLVRALRNIRYRDEPVSFARYGEYATDAAETSPVRELLQTLAWLGTDAAEALPELQALRAQSKGFSKRVTAELDRTVGAIGAGNPSGAHLSPCCPVPGGIRHIWDWSVSARKNAERVRAVIFEDQDGRITSFGEFFKGRPTIVAFFYTRCDNPLKCSLTVTKLAQVQRILAARGLSDEIQTVAITYDPGFDLADRMRAYGQNRGVCLNERHRMLRTVQGFDDLRAYLKLGVNYIQSLVNRHRLEVYVLDSAGRVAGSFERLHWMAEEVAARAMGVLAETAAGPQPSALAESGHWRMRLPNATSWLGTLAAIAIALFPKCPLCWAGYLSLLGIVTAENVPFSPWLQLALAPLILTNLTSLWIRSRALNRIGGFALAAMGAAALFGSKLHPNSGLAVAGIVLTAAGSLYGTLEVRRRGPTHSGSAAVVTPA